LTTFKVREILNGLEKKGFVQSQGDHTHLIFYCNGKKTSIRTKISHGSNEVNDHLISLMSTQVKLEKRKFEDMVNCPFTLADYLKELETQGYNFK
jgi:predicted RNA binding protein YcfA (HicA-like mRNA interferase family)